MSESDGALFKGLSLSAENQEAFKSLLLDKQMALVDLSMGAMDGSGTPEQRKQLASQIAELTRSYDAKIKTLLGEDNFPLYQEYEATQPELDRRLNAYHHNPDEGSPWGIVRDRIRSRR